MSCSVARNEFSHNDWQSTKYRFPFRQWFLAGVLNIGEQSLLLFHLSLARSRQFLNALPTLRFGGSQSCIRRTQFSQFRENSFPLRRTHGLEFLETFRPEFLNREMFFIDSPQ
jgi:hypothetical protein